MSVALSIAGFDPTGGAGLTADLETFASFGVRGVGVITLATAQTRERLSAVRVFDEEFVAEQLSEILADSPPLAIKIGALGNASVVRAVAKGLAGVEAPIILDPVRRPSGGACALLDDDGFAALLTAIVPRATVVTPNLDEAAAWLGFPIRDRDSMQRAARALVEAGAGSALVKGGHLEGDAIDVWCHGGEMRELRASRVPVSRARAHGTGCRLSAGIAGALASGLALDAAVEAAKAALTAYLAS